MQKVTWIARKYQALGSNFWSRGLPVIARIWITVAFLFR